MKYFYLVRQKEGSPLFLLKERVSGDIFVSKTTETLEEEKMKNLVGSIRLFSKKQENAEFIENEESYLLLEQIKKWGYQNAWRRVDYVFSHNEEDWTYEDIYNVLSEENPMITWDIQKEVAGEIVEKIRRILRKIRR